MSFLVKTTFQEVSNLIKPLTNLKVCVRNKAKKAMSTTHSAGNARAKHRGIKVPDGAVAHAGTILALQRKTRFHPGLHVGMGKNGTLYALENGKVAITCEIINPDYSHFWVRKNYTGRENQVIYKKHFNIIPDKQHDIFVLKNAV